MSVKFSFDFYKNVDIGIKNSYTLKEENTFLGRKINIINISIFCLFFVISLLFTLINIPLIFDMIIITIFSSLALILVLKVKHSETHRVVKEITILADEIENANLETTKYSSTLYSKSKYCPSLSNSLNNLTSKYKKNITKIEDNIKIGHALAAEKNHYRLFHTILYYSKKLAGADAGSIFIVEEKENRKFLRFKYSHTFSKNLPYEEFTMPMDTNSIAGYVAVTGEILNIPDVYDINKNMPYSFNKKFDITNNYLTQSILVVPMRDHLNKIIGVIQLINCKEDSDTFTGNEAYEIVLNDEDDMEKYVQPFGKSAEDVIQSIAGEAAIALENIQMLNQMKNQFDSFVKASVTAIESRDPATSGHSFRVAEVSQLIADCISESTLDPFSEVYFTKEQLKMLEYAAMVHDFGKIYIDPGIFLKGKKLFEKDYSFLLLRLELIYSVLKNNLLNEKQNSSSLLHEPIEEEYRSKFESVAVIRTMLAQLNDPTASVENLDDTLDGIISMRETLECRDSEGNLIPLLTEQEIINLRIKRGSLNPIERKIIESHVNYSYSFVSQIPWPPEYARIPEIILCHHEMLDGSGYPNGNKGTTAIPLEARIISIADIFDALRAADRPYKKSMPLKVVLKILNEEADQNKLDKNIVNLFIENKLYNRIK